MPHVLSAVYNPVSPLLGSESVTTGRKLTLPLAAFPAVSPRPEILYWLSTHFMWRPGDIPQPSQARCCAGDTGYEEIYARNALHTQHRGGLIVTAVATDKQSLHAPKYRDTSPPHLEQVMVICGG